VTPLGGERGAVTQQATGWGGIVGVTGVLAWRGVPSAEEEDDLDV
jgi:hypothetical protein